MSGTVRKCVTAPLFPTLHAHFMARLVSVAGDDPFVPQVVLAPGPEFAASVARAIARQHGSGIHLRGMDWAGLAVLLTRQERQQEKRTMLGAEAAAQILRRFLERSRRPPGYFDSSLDSRGFRLALMRRFAELSRIGLVAPKDIERLIVRHGAELSPKLRHALELHLGWRRSVESTHDDEAKALWRASQVPHDRLHECLGSGRLWMFGFRECSGLEKRLLAHWSHDLQLALQVFVPQERGADGLLRLLATLGYDVEELQPAPVSLRSGIQQPRIISAPSEEVEASEVARRLLAAADAGLAFDDMAVVSRTSKQLELLHETLQRVGIPCWHATGRGLASTRAARGLLQWLDLLDADFAPRAVLDFLAVAPLRWRDWGGIGDDAIASAWERVAREACLGRGLEDWRTKLERYRDDASQRALARQQEDEPAIRARQAAAAAADLWCIAQALHGELERFPTAARWSEWAQALERFLSAAFVPSETVAELVAVLARLRALDDTTRARTTLGDLRDVLRSLFGDTTVAIVPPHQSGGVTLGTATELYGVAFDLVCMTGLREGDWPAPVSQDPVFLDREREQLSNLIGEPGALKRRDELLAEDRRLFRSVAGAARSRLVFSFARLDPTTGAARLPSSLLLEWAEHFEARSLDYRSLELLSWFERVPLQRQELPSSGPVFSVEEFDAIAIASLSPPARRRYVRRLGRLPARGLGLDSLRNSRARFTAFDGVLQSRAARAALGEDLRARLFSVSMLATYATCPLRFWMRHLLRVESMDAEPGRELSALESGRIVHRSLELFYRGLTQDAVTIRKAQFAALRQRLHAAVETAFGELEARGRTGARVLWELHKQRLREDLVRHLRAEFSRGAEEDWRPSAFEHRFGPGTPLSMNVPRQGAPPAVLRGVIDRIDCRPDQDGVRVIDYKSGRKLKAAGSAQVLQLVVYLLAACRSDVDRLRRSEARFAYVTRRGGFEIQSVAGSDVVNSRALFERFVDQVIGGAEAGEFFAQPGPNAVHCTVCDYRSACDARIATQTRRKSASGQDARYHALPDLGELLR